MCAYVLCVYIYVYWHNYIKGVFVQSKTAVIKEIIILLTVVKSIKYYMCFSLA